MIIDGAFNHEKLIEFFEALVADTGRKVFLILDNPGVHHCTPVKAWLGEHQAQIEVFYLPSYSPELNREERLNTDLTCHSLQGACTNQGETSRCNRTAHGPDRQRV